MNKKQQRQRSHTSSRGEQEDGAQGSRRRKRNHKRRCLKNKRRGVKHKKLMSIIGYGEKAKKLMMKEILKS